VPSTQNGVAPGPDFRAFALGVEVVPPAGPDAEPLLTQLAALDSADLAGFSVATNPLARPRMSALALSALIQQRTGRPATLHCTTRDHNRLSLQALLWGARALGIGSVLVATGDYVALGERARTTTVRDVNVYELVSLAREAGLQVGVVLDPRPAPPPLKAPISTPEPDRAPSSAGQAGHGPRDDSHLALQVRRLEKKIAAGAQYAVSQPIYDRAAARRLRDATAHLSVPIVLGILPLRSARHARFLHREVAGITVPAAVQQRLEAAADPVTEGILQASQMLALARRWFAGALLMPPFGHYEVVAQILEQAPAQHPPQRSPAL
jgi:methylenetetrahydrofolate reductase (NADPH)